MKKLSANVCSVTHAGRVRRENEDNYSLNGKMTCDGTLKKGSAFVQKMSEPFHIAVCDGMGGESYGELASGIAIRNIVSGASAVYNSGEDFSFAISSILDKANTEICNEITARGTRIGTTLAAVYAIKGRVICVSIGDTRIYHFSNGVLEQISFDHTHAQGFVDAREISQEDVNTIPDAKRLTKHLGVLPEEASIQPTISVIDDVEDGDVILLCSDGLTDMVSDAEIQSVVSDGENPQDVTGKLIRMALEKGGKDNVTIITAFMSAEDTAIFAPIAEAMVGDKDPDYEEEYRNSFGNGEVSDEDVSPYANADSRAQEKQIDKMRILKIGGIVLGAIAVIAVAALIIKAAAGRRGGGETTTTTSLDDYYSNYTSYQYVPESTTELTTWFTETETSEESTETESQDGSTTFVPSHTERPSKPAWVQEVKGDQYDNGKKITTTTKRRATPSDDR